MDINLPLGLMPHDIWVLKRLQAICEAIERYTKYKMEIPIEWIKEYNVLVQEVE